MVLNLCTLSYDALYLVYICTKFHENILDGMKVIEWHNSHKKNLEGVYFSKNEDGVMVLFL